MNLADSFCITALKYGLSYPSHSWSCHPSCPLTYWLLQHISYCPWQIHCCLSHSHAEGCCKDNFPIPSLWPYHPSLCITPLSPLLFASNINCLVSPSSSLTVYPYTIYHLTVALKMLTLTSDWPMMLPSTAYYADQYCFVVSSHALPSVCLYPSIACLIFRL